MEQLDTTAVANAYMRQLEGQIQALVVENVLLKAKLQVALTMTEVKAQEPQEPKKNCQFDCGEKPCDCYPNAKW